MVLQEIYIFIIFILIGSIVGIIFDLFRILRKSFETRDKVTYIEDISFCLIAGIIILFSIFKFASGEIRFYIFVGILIGIIIYMLTLSKIFIKCNVYIIEKIKNIIFVIFKIIKIPINYVIKMFVKIFRKIFFKPISFIFINFRKLMSKKFINSKKILKKGINFKKKKELTK